MELGELICELDNLLGEADLALDAGRPGDSREHLRKAKELLEAEFLAE